MRRKNTFFFLIRFKPSSATKLWAKYPEGICWILMVLFFLPLILDGLALMISSRIAPLTSYGCFDTGIVCVVLMKLICYNHSEHSSRAWMSSTVANVCILRNCCTWGPGSQHTVSQLQPRFNLKHLAERHVCKQCRMQQQPAPRTTHIFAAYSCALLCTRYSGRDSPVWTKAYLNVRQCKTKQNTGWEMKHNFCLTCASSGHVHVLKCPVRLCTR